MSATFTSQSPFGSLPRDAQFVVAVASGLTIGDRHYGLGEHIPREQFREYDLHSLYYYRRIALEPPPPEPPALELQPEAPPEAPVAQAVAHHAPSRPIPGPVHPPRGPRR